MAPWLQSPLDILFNYWMSLRGADGQIPQKSHLNPVKFKAVLPDVSILERTGKENYTYRLIGSDILQRFTTLSSGINLFDRLDPNSATFISDWLEAIFHLPCAAHCHYVARYPTGLKRNMSSLYLPLADKDGTLRFLLAYHRATALEGYSATVHESNIEMEQMIVTPIDLGSGVPDLPKTLND
ncbi:hypothetical protein JCM17844_19150 [Iodidimonas gelatinilytica]|uniref:PAS domain-containing protein n=1 Tax=Iodidimonas gelatinilytica TaxID=1236966 RepID=A0A5A7MTG1_9PROT|nr:PAS domain-containing protein [Iodidimonas gelatinilytica]GEQ98278.1 hypothetical protein JCM17844_19150 [Iodidimonas gelatinilytica]